MKKLINVLAISYGRQLFEPANLERQRMVSCSEKVESHHMVVFTLAKDNFEKVVVDNLSIYPTNSKSRWHMIFDAARLGAQIISDKKSNWVITSQDPFEAGLVATYLSKKLSIPVNVQEHGDFFSTKHWKHDKFTNLFRYSIGKLILKKADSVRVVSQRIKRSMIELGVSPHKIFTLPVRSDYTSRQQLDNVLPSNVKEKHKASLMILSIGRFVSQKNFPLLINAFAVLVKNNPQALLVLVGKGEKESAMKNLVSTLGINKQVVFMPWTDNPLSLIKEADIYALSSNWEGWARVLVESMSVGTPVVTTDVGCVGEVIVNNVHGFVVPIGNQKSYTEKLIDLSSEATKRADFRHNALRDFTNVDIAIEDYADQWADLLFRTHSLNKA